MAEQLQEKTDWSKFFMAMAAGAIVIMQSYSQMQHTQTRTEMDNINKELVPRNEVANASRALDEKINSLQTRLDLLERAMIAQGVVLSIKGK